MQTRLSPLAGQPAPLSSLVNVAALVTAYYTETPDPDVIEQQIAFGTSGHRGSAFDHSFNEWHVLAITQAICQYRQARHINGPLFLGIDTHALSVPACASALEVLAANGVEVMLPAGGESSSIYTPTPAISQAILAYNHARGSNRNRDRNIKSDSDSGLADGIVITPSHNPPRDGGLKYNLPHGGPADAAATRWIETCANSYLKNNLQGVKRISYAAALRATTTHRHDFLNAYVHSLGSVIDMDAIRGAKIQMGVDPLGGAGVHYWPAIAEHYGLDLGVVNAEVDQRFRFVPVDWDGQIRMDPSSPYAMKNLVSLMDGNRDGEHFDIAFGCDTDHDRHGIVTRSTGLLPSNHYLVVAIHYLFQHRPHWGQQAAIGKTIVSTRMIDRVAAKLGRQLVEMPVGFKWFAEGLFNASLGFGGEESAGATFLRQDGTVWTTDKDGMIAGLLAAEITAQMGRDPGEIYRELTHELGECYSDRIDAPATAQQKQILSALQPSQVATIELGGEKILSIINHAPGNGASLGGIKVVAENGWFAARPSGTENIYKIYAESFLGEAHLRRITDEAQMIIDAAFGAAGKAGNVTGLPA